MSLHIRFAPRSAAAWRCAIETSGLRPAKRRRQGTDAPRSPSSVSHDEIAHFTRLSDVWWDEEGEFKLLHRMNAPRTHFVRERVALASDADPSLADQVRFLAGKRVLDVGCGGGLFTEVLARLGGETTGLDAAIANVAVAEAHAALDPHFSSPRASSRLTYRHATAEKLVEEGETFDVVCSMEVVEHVEDPRAFLQSLADLTKPGGHIILSSINRTLFARFLTITVAESPLVGFVSPGTHTYRKFVKPEEIESFFGDDLGWRQTSEPELGPTASAAEVAARGSYIPPQERVETRGVIYSPLSGRWRLQPRFGGPATKMCNYFAGIRKPVA